MVQKIADNCCGCGACASVCPKGAIEMSADAQGFYKPRVLDSCIECGACLRVCPVENPPEGTQAQGFYACAAEAERVLRSSSGGVFPLLAEAVLENNGSVFGCGWGEDLLPEHICIDNTEELHRLYGSKYAQSRMDRIYLQVKKCLQQGQQVLFSGTPCQVAGLRRFLNKEYDHLIAVDFICHGVPSSRVLKKHLDELETKQGSKAVGLTFRDKTKGWKELQLTVNFCDGSQYTSPAAADPYYRAFLGNLSLNRICGKCPFNVLPRCSDITLGDFWKVERHHAGFDDNAGVSCVVVNSKKGEDIFAKIREKMTVVESTQADIMDGNPFLNGHCSLHKRRNKFFSAVDTLPLQTHVDDCLKLTRWEWIMEVLAYKLKKK